MSRKLSGVTFAALLAGWAGAMDADNERSPLAPWSAPCMPPPAPFDLGCGPPSLPWVNTGAQLPEPVRPAGEDECAEDWGELHYDYLDAVDVTVDVRSATLEHLSFSSLS